MDQLNRKGFGDIATSHLWKTNTVTDISRGTELERITTFAEEEQHGRTVVLPEQNCPKDE